MTSNQIAAKRADEEERHNKKSEGIETAKIVTSGIGSLIKGAVGLFNDHWWFEGDEQLLKDAASLSYGEPLGSKAYDMTVNENVSAQTKTYQRRGIPGMMVLRYMPTLPDEDTVNVISKNIYAYVRHANSGHTNYEANDLQQYFNAVMEPYCAIVDAMRAYSLLNTYKSENYYYAKDIITAMGLDFTTFNSNIAQLRYKINTWVNRINAFRIPNVFPLFNRRIWLNSTIFKDYPVKRSSEYLFRPIAVGVYSEGSFGSRIQFTSFGNSSTPLTFTAYCALIDSMIDAIFASEDLGIMSGDILKAYGDTLVKLPEIPEDFHIESVYSEEVLSEINGATLVGTPVLSTFDIYTQTVGANSYIRQGTFQIDQDRKTEIFTAANVATLEIVSLEKPFINQLWDDVKPVDNAVATRFTATCTNEVITNSSNNHDYRRIIKVCGTEVICYAVIASRQISGGVLTPRVDIFWDGIIYTYANLSNNGIFNDTTMYSKFDWAPRMRLQMYNSGGTAVYNMFDSQDLANFVQVPEEVLANIHKVCALSLYNVSNRSLPSMSNSRSVNNNKGKGKFNKK